MAGWCWLASIVLVTYINAAWECWWYGLSFGHRAFEGCNLFAMVGLAWLVTTWERRPPFQWLGVATLGFLILWNLHYFLLQTLWRRTFGSPVQYPVTWGDILETGWRFWTGG